MRTTQTAVVLIPPPEVWIPIQAIRRELDRQFRRWMPHLTLLYPFYPRSEFADREAQLRGVCRAHPVIDVCFASLGCFDHGHGSYTLWLAPEPAESLVSLHRALLQVAPDCIPEHDPAGAFTPHLGLGQVRGNQAMIRMRRVLEANWKPLSVRFAAVSMIWRHPPPDDVFRVWKALPLGGGAQA